MRWKRHGYDPKHAGIQGRPGSWRAGYLRTVVIGWFLVIGEEAETVQAAVTDGINKLDEGYEII